MTVTAVVIARTREGAGLVLTALLAQDRLPDRVLLVDGAADGIGDTDGMLAPLDDAGIDVLRTTLGPHRGIRRMLPATVDAIPRASVGRDLLWVLTSRARPHPEALHWLAAAVGHGVGMAAPKLVDRDRPREIIRLGHQVTRTGRLVHDPLAGTLDEGQHDHAVDAIGAPLEGLLVDRALFERLDGHDPSMGDLGGDLDLGWRSQRAGQRLVLVPSAAVAVTPTAAERHPTTAQRRQARRVAVTRANILLAPFLALWIAIGSLALGLGLLLIKRPRMALEELAQAGAGLDPRTLRSRTRGRSPREVSRRHLTNLFVTRSSARRRIIAEVRGPTLREDAFARPSAAARTGPRLLHPLPWLVVAATAMSAWAARSVTGGLWRSRESGLVGGELLGGRATGEQLWHAWRMAWHGPGWGHGTELSPAHLLLALPTTLIQWLPGTVHSPAGMALAVLMVIALPLAAVVAWSSARTFTPRPWPRAFAAMAWVSSAPAAVAVGEGRIGALLALILLPRIAAGLVRVGRGGVRYSDSARTALWTAVVATTAPIVGLAVILVGLIHLAVGDAGRRLRGLTLVLVPLLLAGPWLLTLRAEPRRLLTGWGLTDTRFDAEPWRLVLGHLPGGAPTTWWTAAVLALGLLALLAPGVRRTSWAAAVTALLGLAWAVGVPHLVIGHRPEGADRAGELVTPWVGTGQLALIGAALVAILVAADTLPARMGGGGARRWLWLPAMVLPVAAVGSGVVVGLHSYGDDLAPWHDPRPRVAVSAAEGSTATRSLVIEPLEDAVRYRIIGREPGPLVRDLVLPQTSGPGEDQVDDAVARLLGSGEGDRAASEVLAEQAISHVVVVEPSTAQRRGLDSAGGLTRLWSDDGRTTWLVRPPLTDGSTPSRARVVTGDRSAPVRGTGAHAETHGEISVPDGDQLVVAESIGWSEHVEVRADGRILEMGTRSAIPTYDLPEGTERVGIDVATGHRIWKIVQGLALVLALHLAVPTERPPRVDQEETR